MAWTMKRTKLDMHSNIGHHLPQELLVKVALCLEDSATFFAFLDALGSPEARGPLEIFYVLAQRHPRNYLWPVARLTSFNAPLMHVFSCIAEFCTRVAVADMYDLDVLQQIVQPTTRIEWRDIPDDTRTTEPLEPWFNQWSKLRITSVASHGRGRLGPFIQVLPRLHHLTHLDMSGLHNEAWLDRLLKFIATSKVTSLSLNVAPGDAYSNIRRGPLPRPAPTFSAAMVENLTLWFQTQPVTHFRIARFCYDDEASPTQLVDAIFHCPSLQVLALMQSTEAASLIVSPTGRTFPKKLREFHLVGCTISSDDVANLGAALVSSTIQVLDLRHSVVTACNRDGVKALLGALPRTCVRELHLTNCGLGDEFWTHAASLLTATPLSTVTLDDNAITNHGATLIAHALALTSSIHTIHFEYNNIGLQGAHNLLALSGATVRRINLSGNGFSYDHRVSLEREAQKRGLTLLT
ncbi:Aste57867_16044 [Aphanomyces stellatus]|uniref:Aste57867_16044 protein n=1 Tax=Aphanomyces stellatus TaxID=120398 RepID=A0A485L5W3_9STRA|nr:hypothetical protein As57867_015988 [Aphanomyces stellatus]VFT92828.1 Aste57867_16044 [Aphanomyces stellatus]